MARDDDDRRRPPARRDADDDRRRDDRDDDRPARGRRDEEPEPEDDRRSSRSRDDDRDTRRSRDARDDDRRSSRRDDDDDRGSRRRDDDDDRRPSRDDRDDRRSRRDDDDDRRPARDDDRRSSRDDDDRGGRDRGRTVRHNDDKDDRRSRDDDPDDRPQRRGKGALLKAGWDAADKTIESTSSFSKGFRPEDDYQIVKFMEDTPFVSYRQHWFQNRNGQKSFICLDGLHSDGCPLCDQGDRPSAIVGFNVAVLSDERDTDPVLKPWEARQTVANILKEFNTDPKNGPLTKNYWAVKKGKKAKSEGRGGNTPPPSILPVRARDLFGDYGMDELTDDQISDLERKLLGPDYITIPRYSDLEDVAEELDKR